MAQRVTFLIGLIESKVHLPHNSGWIGSYLGYRGFDAEVCHRDTQEQACDEAYQLALEDGGEVIYQELDIHDPHITSIKEIE